MALLVYFKLGERRQAFYLFEGRVHVAAVLDTFQASQFSVKHGDDLVPVGLAAGQFERYSNGTYEAGAEYEITVVPQQQAPLAGPGAPSATRDTQEQLLGLTQQVAQLTQQVAQYTQQLATTVTQPVEAGKKLMESAIYTEELLAKLAYVEEDVLTSLLQAQDVQARFLEASQQQLEEPVQKLYYTILSKLQSVRPGGGQERRLHVQDTHATGVPGLHRKPDLTITDSAYATAPHIVWYVEVKKALRETTLQREALYQIKVLLEDLKREQPARNEWVAITGGIDCLQLWSLDRLGTIRCTPQQALTLDRRSPALQTLVRLWCTAPETLGYRRPYLPSPLRLYSGHYNGKSLEKLFLMKESSSKDEGMLSPLISYVYRGELQPDHGWAIAKHSHNAEQQERERQALVALTEVDSVVNLVGMAVDNDDEKHYLVMQPVGDLFSPLEPLMIVRAFEQLCAAIGAIADRGYLHGDISAFNVVGRADGSIMLIDFGEARLLSQAATDGFATGTPLFMAITTLQKRPQTVSSELESALYVFLYWATQGGLHWRKAPFGFPSAIDSKWTAMTLLFEDKVLSRIDSDQLRRVARKLRDLFFPLGLQDTYRTDVVAADVASLNLSDA
eukprot:jgi/Chlat1/7191/Chrsp57S09130